MLKKVFTLAIVISFAIACEDVADLLTFHFNDRTEIQIQSPAGLNLPIQVTTPSVTSSSQQQFQNNNTNAELVRDVKLEQLKMTLTSPSGKTFSFLKNIRIFISSDEAEEIELAWLENVPSAATVELTPTTEKLDVYAKSPTYYLRTEVTTDETLTEDVDVQVDLRFRVTADAF